jgi:hypothetical protein
MDSWDSGWERTILSHSEGNVKNKSQTIFFDLNPYAIRIYEFSKMRISDFFGQPTSVVL